MNEQNPAAKWEDRFNTEMDEIANMDESDFYALLIESRTIQDFNRAS